MLNQFPDEIRNKVGNLFIVAHKGLFPKNNYVATVQPGDQIVLGPLLTIGDVEAVFAPAMSLYAATQPVEVDQFTLGVAQIEAPGLSGSLNSLFGLDAEGRDLPLDEFIEVVGGVQGLLAETQGSTEWVRRLPHEVQQAMRPSIVRILDVLRAFPISADATGFVLAGMTSPDASIRELTFEMAEFLIAGGFQMPPTILKEIFQKGIVDRWTRKAGLKE